MSNGINAPYGLVAVESVSGDGATRKMREYKIVADGVGNVPQVDLFYGDPVKFKGGSLANPSNAGSIIPAITPAVAGTAGTAVVGAFVGTFIGCQYIDPITQSSVTSRYWKSGTPIAPNGTISVFVNDDPNVIFRVQMSTAIDNQDKAIFLNRMIGQNATLASGGVDFTADNWSFYEPKTPIFNPNSGNIKSSQSVIYLDGNSIAVNAGGNLAMDVKIIGLAPSSSVHMALATAPSSFTNKTPGVDMPFCDVLVKFNNHIFGSGGVAGPILT